MNICKLYLGIKYLAVTRSSIAPDETGTQVNIFLTSLQKTYIVGTQLEVPWHGASNE